MQYITCPDQFSFGGRSSAIFPKQFTHQLKVLQKQNLGNRGMWGGKEKLPQFFGGNNYKNT